MSEQSEEQPKALEWKQIPKHKRLMNIQKRQSEEKLPQKLQ